MKISKKLLSVALSIFVLTTFLAFGNPISSKVLADDIPIQLYYSNFTQLDRSGLGYDEGYIAVKNLAYDKKITVHYTNDGVTWNDSAASYLKTNSSDGNEVWYFKIPANSYTVTNFALKYEANGATYWDNNNNNNYIIKNNVACFGKSYLFAHLPSGYLYDGINHFSVGIFLKNIGSPKIVKLRYTEDNWATYKDVDAQYSYSEDGVTEYWNAAQNFYSSTKQIQYAVSYTVNGVEYWDNNFGQNYTYTFSN